MRFSWAGRIAGLYVACCGPVLAIDLLPTDARAPMPGHTFGQITWQESHFDDFRVKGVTQPTVPALDVTTTSLRVGHSFALGGQPAYAYLQLPYVEMSTRGPVRRSVGGYGDLASVLAWWPYVDRLAGRYAGVAAYLILPTGEYESARGTFNPGENRTRTALQAGYHTNVLPRLDWNIAVDAVWFGKNDDFGPAHANLERKTLYTTQTALLFMPQPGLQFGATWFFIAGGETSVNGLAQENAVRQQRWLLSGIADLPFGRAILQYGQDQDTENGYLEQRRWALRLLMRF